MLNLTDIQDYKLVYPSKLYWESYIEALREGFVLSLANPRTDAEIEQINANPDLHIKQINDQTEKIPHPNGQLVDKNHFGIFWLVKGQEFLGVIGIVYDLDEYLKDYGGHLGVGIRPSMRGKNLATIATTLLTAHAQFHGINSISAVCNTNNIAMRRAFEKSGGIYLEEKEHGYFPDTVVRKYEIRPDRKLVSQILKAGLVPAEKPYGELSLSQKAQTISNTLQNTLRRKAAYLFGRPESLVEAASLEYNADAYYCSDVALRYIRMKSKEERQDFQFTDTKDRLLMIDERSANLADKIKPYANLIVKDVLDVFRSERLVDAIKRRLGKKYAYKGDEPSAYGFTSIISSNVFLELKQGQLLSENLSEAHTYGFSLGVHRQDVISVVCYPMFLSNPTATVNDEASIFDLVIRNDGRFVLVDHLNKKKTVLDNVHDLKREVLESLHQYLGEFELLEALTKPSTREPIYFRQAGFDPGFLKSPLQLGC